MEAEKITVADLPGGAELCDWFGGVPRFHDAYIRELEIRQGAPSRLVAHTFKMGTDVDERGYFILTKHVTVTFTILKVISVELFDFMGDYGIIGHLDIKRDDHGITLDFDSSYGVWGK